MVSFFVNAYTLFFVICVIGSCISKNVSTEKQVESIDGLYLQNIADKLSDNLNRTNDEELGVTFIKKMYDGFKYVPALPDVEKVIINITSKLEVKLSEVADVLNQTRTIIEKYFYSNDCHSLNSAVFECFKTKNEMREYEIFQVKGALNNSYSEENFSIEFALSSESESFKLLKGSIKQLYFLSSFDVKTETYAPITSYKKHDQSLLWKNYMTHIKTTPRNVMLLLDHGVSLSKWQLEIVKLVAKQTIAVLNPEDKIGLLAIAEDSSAPFLTEQCLTPNQMPPANDLHTIVRATEHNKELLYKFIDTLDKGSGGTNHSAGFQHALNVIATSDIGDNERIMLLYISRGLLSSLSEAKTVMETISEMMIKVQRSVIINTCAVVNESKPIMYEMHFLRDIAQQNYSKYNIESTVDVQIGLTLSVSSAQSVGLAVARFYNTLHKNVAFNTEPGITLPTWDPVSKDLTIAATVACGKNGELGLIGVDLYFSNIAEDITYYSSYEDYTYGFILTNHGSVIAHPSYPRPVANNKQPVFVDISYLEKVDNFTEVREKILQRQEGSVVLQTGNSTINYVWKHVAKWYTICLVVKDKGKIPVRPYNRFVTPPPIWLLHHRFEVMDIVPAHNLCRHLNQIATLNAGTVYLSASCFQTPFAHIRFSSASSYMAYLKDNTRLLANPGLKEEIRDDVATLSHVLKYLSDQHLKGFRSRYIVRRYVASYSGVLEMFPGSAIPHGLEPTRRTWFLRASEHKFRTVLTPPYLDAGGAGYIVTLAYSTEDLVVAMDVTYGYVFKLLLEEMPFCKKKNIKCFMIDDRGYLIYHPNLIDPNGHGPIEQQHIIHKESLVANDILNHKYFVKKMLCNNYADGTIQRFYKLNTTLNKVLANAVQGEHCVKYQVTAVKNTNVFVGIVNVSCEDILTFCPCSMVDRLCLVCNRMEQKECECPCECPLNLNNCTHPNRNFTDNPICETVPEQQNLPDYSNNQTDLKPCISFMCETQLAYNTCLGLTGCEWCHMDADGVTLLPRPFCTSITACFNGILGSPTPYGDSHNNILPPDDLISSPYSPVGPVIGSVVGMCLVLILLFFCYRSYTSQAVERFYLTSTQDNQIRMSDLNISDDYHELDNHQDKLLQDTKKPEPLSPYCVSTGYRRPQTAVDSDHGYSTMTPHDESEHLSFAPVEIDSLEDDCVSDNTSINTSFSCKQSQIPAVAIANRNKSKLMNQLTDLQTAIPNRNCIVAPVTVHRNMETTQ